MTKAIIYILEDVIVVFRRDIYAEPHQHHAIQLTLGLGNAFNAVIDDNLDSYQILVINHDILHQVQGQNEWVMSLLINPESSYAKAIQNQFLKDASYQSIDMALPNTIHQALLASVEKPLTCQEIQTIISRIQERLGLTSSTDFRIDPRISEALKIIESLPEKKIALKDLSDEVYLSEGRFGHLFRDEIGIPLRRYLLWQRLLKALSIISQDEKFTFAAHEAGFTDSAHLSRTFYQMFGINLSDMFAHRDLVYVLQCY